MAGVAAPQRGVRTLPVQVAGAQGWSDGQMMLAVLLLNVIGHERVSDVDALEADRSLCRLVRDYEPELLGVMSALLAARFRGGRGRTFPSANAVHDWLRRFHKVVRHARNRRLVLQMAHAQRVR